MSAFAVDAIVTDIEGTTGSVAFVKDVLFPYAETHMADFVASHARETAPILDEVRQLAGDPSLSGSQSVDRLAAWAREDRKIAPLKTLQGMIWAEGYASGELVGHVYEDAAVALSAWHEQGFRLYVYSSGSVQAQKLIFRHTRFGDLSQLFSGHFDTRIGGKLERSSYSRIAAEIGASPARLLFLSDHSGEIAAAAQAGWRTQLIDREGGAPGAVASFADIAVERAR